MDRLYKKLVRSKSGGEGVFGFKTFEYFMREVQKVCVLSWLRWDGLQRSFLSV